MPTSLPQAFTDEINAILGDEAPAFFEALDRPKCAAFRVNALRSGAPEVCEKYMESRVPWEENGYYALNGTRPGAGLAHICGAVYIQDASAMAPVAVLDPKPGEVILDMCSAPGGKSSQIAGRLQGQGVLISNEYVKSRAQILKSNLERLGAVNVTVTNASPEKFSNPVFDAILVDAPCSGEGMFRRDEGALDEWTSESPKSCAIRQAKVLDSAAQALKPGGRMVYSTCTFNRHENEWGIKNFLSRHPEFSFEDFSLPGVGDSKEGCLRLWPHRIKGEGHFLCRLVKSGESHSANQGRRRPSKEASSALELLKKSVPAELPDGCPEMINGELWLVPWDEPDLPNIYMLSKGLDLGKPGKGFFEPSHALAMALSKDKCRNCVSLDDEEASLYMQGEALSKDASGWTLMLWNSLPLGWGKASGGIIKNHLPKGLRRRGGHAIDSEA